MAPVWTPPNTCFTGPTWFHNPNASQSVQPLLHSSRQRVAILYNGPPPFSFKIAPSMKPHLIHGSLGPPKSSTQTTSRSLQLFLHTLPQSVRILYNKLPIPLKTAPSHGGSVPPSNTWFPGSTQVLNPNSISIGIAVFAGLTNVTDRQTDHATRSVTIGRIYVHSTAMRPNNSKQKYLWLLLKRQHGFNIQLHR